MLEEDNDEFFGSSIFGDQAEPNCLIPRHRRYPDSEGEPGPEMRCLPTVLGPSDATLSVSRCVYEGRGMLASRRAPRALAIDVSSDRKEGADHSHRRRVYVSA